MALRHSFTDQFGTIHSAAYHRIEVMGSMTSMTARVVIYHDASARASGVPPLSEMHVPFVPEDSGVNVVAQAYAHVKSLPEFSGAVDC
jgi:hypothetical protein